MIETQSLTKRYGDKLAVEDVSFTCAPGTVTGFLGANGAGKSTTLKMLCGLAQPTQRARQRPRRAVQGAPQPRSSGRRIDRRLRPTQRPARRRGARHLRQLMGVESRRVERMLELVGLDSDAGRKRVGEYSLGMRQRLGIAHALLGDPEVLILDEPSNGLDPEGMRWMRGLLRDFAERGGTVLLSSHLLHEVSAIADRLVVIAGGRIVAQGTPEELLGNTPKTAVRAAGGPGAGADLRDALQHASITVREGADGTLLADAEPDQISQVALRAGVALTELRPAQDGGNLEELFFRLTAGEEPPPNGSASSQDDSLDFSRKDHR